MMKKRVALKRGIPKILCRFFWLFTFIFLMHFVHSDSLYDKIEIIKKGKEMNVYRGINMK